MEAVLPLLPTELVVDGQRFTFEHYHSGDYTALSKAYGHRGQNCYFPCLWCDGEGAVVEE